MLTPGQQSVLDALSGAAIIAYLLVAYVQMVRPVSAEARTARNGFVLWWTGIALLGFYGLISEAFFDVNTLQEYRLVIYTLIPLIFAALGGLVYYLAFLYTGKRKSLWTVFTFYAVLTVLFIAYIEAQQPYFDAAIDPATGEEVGFEFAREAPAWMGLLFSISLVLPPLAAAVAYFALFFRARDNTVRFRILMVSGGFILWMGFSLLGSLTRFAQGIEERGFESELISQLLGILSALMVLMAYFPPRTLQKHYGLRDLSSDTAVMTPVPMDDEPKRLAPVPLGWLQSSS